jgi:azurin
MTLSTTLAALALIMSAASPARLTAQKAAAGPRTIELKASDAMKYDVTTIQAKPGEQLRVRLSAAGTIPKMVMSHNFVLLKKGSSPQTFAEKSATANTTGYIAPELKPQILASTILIGNGEKAEVTFKAPTVPAVTTISAPSLATSWPDEGGPHRQVSRRA